MLALSRGRLVVVLCAGLSGGPAAAQTICRLLPPSGTDRQVLQCGEGVRVEASPGARVRPLNLDSDRDHEGVEVTNGRVLARVRGRPSVLPAGRNRRRPGRPFEFQIRTPHAVASVRGTVWAVGVERGRTSIYVKDGAVRVRRRRDGRSATMTCNEGIDISSRDRGRLNVHEWSPGRSDAFLRSFGLSGGCVSSRRSPRVGPQLRLFHWQGPSRRGRRDRPGRERPGGRPSR